MNATRGVVFALMGSLTCALMSVVVKFMTDDQSVWGILLFQSFAGLLFAMPRASRQIQTQSIKTNLIGIHFLRALTGVGSCALSYVALHYIPLSLEMVLASSFPIFVPIFAVLMGERFDRRLIKYIALSFLGVWLVANPSVGPIHPAAFLAVGCGIFTALTLVLMKFLLKRGESPSRSVFFYTLFSSLMVATMWTLQPHPSLAQWPLGVVLGLLFYLQQMSFNVACQHLEPVRFSILMYSALVFTGIIDFLVWNFLPSGLQFLGMAIVVVSSIFAVALRQRNSKECIEQLTVARLERESAA